jgi:cysteine desulfurase/selenocysteine lyase
MKKFVYVDAGASWLKPQSLVEKEVEFLRKFYANAGRGVCARAGNVDDLILLSREKVADFIGAGAKNIVWTSGTTDAFNRIVNIVKNTLRKKCPVVAVSDLDHHSARIPWEMCAVKGDCKLVVMPLDNDLNINVNKIPKADVVVITAMSNVLGVAQDVKAIISAAKNKNSKVITIVDAAQSVVHSKIDVKKIDCDFLCFSGHKIGSDTGIGIMYIKNPEGWNVDKFGGGMVNKITDQGLIINQSPERFEAGTLPITQIIGLPCAIEYRQQWDGGHDLIAFMYDELSKIENIKILTKRDACMLSFVPKNMHVLDFGVLIGAHNICLRVGNMCATWIHKKLKIDGSVRISVGPWNTMSDAKYVVDKIKSVVK